MHIAYGELALLNTQPVATIQTTDYVREISLLDMGRRGAP
jgi:hypothetical protein